jgi:hypothetical protein
MLPRTRPLPGLRPVLQVAAPAHPASAGRT